MNFACSVVLFAFAGWLLAGGRLAGWTGWPGWLGWLAGRAGLTKKVAYSAVKDSVPFGHSPPDPVGLQPINNSVHETCHDPLHDDDERAPSHIFIVRDIERDDDWGPLSCAWRLN